MRATTCRAWPLRRSGSAATDEDEPPFSLRPVLHLDPPHSLSNPAWLMLRLAILYHIRIISILWYNRMQISVRLASGRCVGGAWHLTAPSNLSGPVALID